MYTGPGEWLVTDDAGEAVVSLRLESGVSCCCNWSVISSSGISLKNSKFEGGLMLEF